MDGLLKRRTKTKVGEGSEIVIPEQFMEELNLKLGDTVVMLLEHGEIRIFTPEQGIRNAQAIVRKYVPEGVSLADELVAERHAEAERE